MPRMGKSLCSCPKIAPIHPKADLKWLLEPRILVVSLHHPIDSKASAVQCAFTLHGVWNTFRATGETPTWSDARPKTPRTTSKST